jgi:hypothetical protein
VEATALRHGLSSAAGALKPGGWCTLLLEDGDPERLLAVTVAAVGGGLELRDIIHRESATSGTGTVVHLRKPSGEDRLRQAVEPGPLRLGAEAGRLTYPELAGAVDIAVTELLRDRGEPAGLTRVVAAVLLELGRRGLLRAWRRRRATRPMASRGSKAGARPCWPVSSTRSCGATTIRRWSGIGEEAAPQWWLKEPRLAERPLADRVEWATWSILSTAGRIDEAGFLDRIYRLFPGLQAPDEELVRACLAAYVGPGSAGRSARPTSWRHGPPTTRAPSPR